MVLSVDNTIFRLHCSIQNRTKPHNFDIDYLMKDYNVWTEYLYNNEYIINGQTCMHNKAILFVSQGLSANADSGHSY